MKKKKGFKLRTVCGEHVIVSEGRENIDFSKIISLNESAAYLWEKSGDGIFSVDDLVALLLQEYDVDETMAREDASQLAEQWIEAGIVQN